ncbi:Ty1/Copia-like polyprotein/retrotransposon, putative [Medicago truncatula]|uniref:Ty1/Copia-like polyprotein/retrotransposon, putative n=1 Tax=Medicago truncatula TaxID=3880 RepID=A0A072U0Z6_MEDTR|nr:Ty1/Copia-like polyprotein/retrotransposon, putative [Medicago truncatula]
MARTKGTGNTNPDDFPPSPSPTRSPSPPSPPVKKPLSSPPLFDSTPQSPKETTPFETPPQSPKNFQISSRDKIERNSTSGACQFLGNALISWSCRKQNTIALSTTEAEYVSAANCCSQVLWIKNQLEDFSIRYTNIPVFCDNTNAINLSKNPIQHSRSKHIEIKHHFIRDHVNKK